MEILGLTVLDDGYIFTYSCVFSCQSKSSDNATFLSCFCRLLSFIIKEIVVRIVRMVLGLLKVLGFLVLL